MLVLSKRSFTLVECVVGIILIALLIIAVFSSLIVVFSNVRKIMELKTASLILQEEVSLARELKFSDIEGLGANFTPSNVFPLHNVTGTITKAPYQGKTGILDITFTLEWIDFNGRASSKSIVTLMTDHGINKR